jgi:hypothetical protein
MIALHALVNSQDARVVHDVTTLPRAHARWRHTGALLGELAGREALAGILALAPTMTCPLSRSRRALPIHLTRAPETGPVEHEMGYSTRNTAASWAGPAASSEGRRGGF